MCWGAVWRERAAAGRREGYRPRNTAAHWGQGWPCVVVGKEIHRMEEVGS